MPTLPKKTATKRAPAAKRKPTSDQKFYHSKRWKDMRGVYLRYESVCEVHKYLGKQIDCTQNEPIDHIIPISKGGAPLDSRNLMTLCTTCHSIKTGMETRRDIVSPSPEAVHGELYPLQQEKERLIKHLAKYVNGR